MRGDRVGVPSGLTVDGAQVFLFHLIDCIDAGLLLRLELLLVGAAVAAGEDHPLAADVRAVLPDRHLQPPRPDIRALLAAKVERIGPLERAANHSYTSL